MSPTQYVEIALALLAAGAVTGVFAGLFGIGGGAVIVPVLDTTFRALGYGPELSMPLAVGTSLAVIVPTSITSYVAHRKAGAVDMAAIRIWALPTILGATAGCVIAAWAPSWVFKAVFIAVGGFNGVRFITQAQIGSSTVKPIEPVSMTLYGGVIGLASSLMGIAGGMLSTLWLMHLGRAINVAVATSAAIGIFVAVPGALGYVAAGWGKLALLPPGSLGFISLPALVLVGLTSSLVAPFGARLAHRFEKRKLQRWFGIYLIIASLRFGFDLLGLNVVR
jgi:uncharacterized membrane protein YfcA